MPNHPGAIARSAVVFLLLFAAASARPPAASCANPHLLTTLHPARDNYSYVVNPTLGFSLGVPNSTVSDRIEGIFWAVGVGNPVVGLGVDNGSFPAREWVYTYPGYPAFVLTTWAASTKIDPCPDVMGPIGQRCTAMFLTDPDAERGHARFALLSARDDPASGGFFFDQDDGGSIVLATMPPMTIVGPATQDLLPLEGPRETDLLPGVYLDDASACRPDQASPGDPLMGLVIGFRTYKRVLPRNAPPPSNFVRTQWDDAGLGDQPLGDRFTLDVGCGGEADTYVAYALVFDGGFLSHYLSEPTTRVECGPNLSVPDGPTRKRPTGRRAVPAAPPPW